MTTYFATFFLGGDEPGRIKLSGRIPNPADYEAKYLPAGMGMYVGEERPDPVNQRVHVDPVTGDKSLVALDG